MIAYDVRSSAPTKCRIFNIRKRASRDLVLGKNRARLAGHRRLRSCALAGSQANRGTRPVAGGSHEPWVGGVDRHVEGKDALNRKLVRSVESKTGAENSTSLRGRRRFLFWQLSTRVSRQMDAC